MIAAVTQVEAAISVGCFHGGDYEFGATQVADFVERAEIKVLDVPGAVLRCHGALAAYQAKIAVVRAIRCLHQI